ncbi:site-specific DNA-methyltransferase [Enterococcus gallinarum]|uniref:DNA-methyltransferase n=1 Tax=Enterococcus gallinarum TaxID=1353 RepID=UPI00338D574E
MTNLFYKLLNIQGKDELKKLATKIGISSKKLEYYGENQIVPQGEDKKIIKKYLNITEFEYRLKLGDIDYEMIDYLSEQFDKKIDTSKFDVSKKKKESFTPTFRTDFGKLYNEDSLLLMEEIESDSIDLIFADPPFNLGKKYDSLINDKLDHESYLRWNEQWIKECVRILKPGGSIFIWNIPKWSIPTANILGKYLTLRHWIAVDMKYGLPIPNKLYPAHYSLLYYTKGPKPNTFHPDRLPLEVCKKCGHELKDYGGYKNRMNPKGVSLSDVWHDIYPVRHAKYKNRQSNELPVKLLERIISMASEEGDLVFDPFGGSGTTYVVAEVLKRHWIGSEIGSINLIEERLNNIKDTVSQIENIQKNLNQLFLPETKKIREKNGYWIR